MIFAISTVRRRCPCGRTSTLPNGRTLDLAEATVGGSVFVLDDPDLRCRPTIVGRIEMGRTTIHGGVLVRNAELMAPQAGRG